MGIGILFYDINRKDQVDEKDKLQKQKFFKGYIF